MEVEEVRSQNGHRRGRNERGCDFGRSDPAPVRSAFLEIGGAGFSLMPQGFPTNAHLHCSGADALVRGRPPGRPVELWKCLTLRTSSGTRASRADQGSAPPFMQKSHIWENLAEIGRASCRERV